MSRKTFAALVILLLVVAAVIWFARKKSSPATTPVLSVSAQNQTKNISATNSPASAGDVIVYTLTAQNQSNKVINGYIVEANTSEITDKSTLLDASGASYNSATNSLVWTPLDIPANGSIAKTFSVKVNSLPAGSTNSTLKITFNNVLQVTIAVPEVAGSVTPTPNVTPVVTQPLKAPVTGSSEWLPVILALVLTILYAFRKKLLGITSRI